MSEQSPTIVIVDQDHERSTRISHRLRALDLDALIVLASGLAAGMQNVTEVLNFTRYSLSEPFPQIDLLSPAAVETHNRHYAEARHFPTSNSAQYRQQQHNLSAHYSAVAKWSGGGYQMQHRSRENRIAERQRNWSASSFNKG